jgi:cobalt-zinc-cadmium efflux system protein
VYLVAEVIGGLWTGSLALLADAGHMASDVAALGLSLFAMWLAERPAGTAHTFGYRRFEILAALANGVALVVVAIFIVIEAVERAQAPTPVMGGPMLAIAAGGLVVNLIGLAILHGGRDDSLNVRGAFLHVLSDALGSVGAMAAGACIWAFGWNLADPIASLVICLLVLHASWALLRETTDVLLEAAPAHLDVDEMRAALLAVPGVGSVHDLHVWTITSGMVSLSCHVRRAEPSKDADLLGQLQDVLQQRFRVHHVTIQVEPEDFEEAGQVC